MSHYLLDTRCRGLPEKIRVGHEGHVVGFRKQNWFVHNLVTIVGEASFHLKLPAPWTGHCFKLEQDGVVLAAAARPTYKRDHARIELELLDRQIEMVSESRGHYEWLFREDEQACGTYLPREAKDEWNFELHAPREWSMPLAAMVAFMIGEIPRGRGSSH